MDFYDIRHFKSNCYLLFTQIALQWMNDIVNLDI